MLKFLTRHLGEGYQLSNSDIFGRYLFNLLRSPHEERQYEEFLERYTQKFPVKIVPYMVADRMCKNCSSYTIVNFNSFAEGVFFKEFHDFVQFRVEENMVQAKVAIEAFCKRNGFTEDDIAYETLKKNWNRYWKKEKKRLAKLNNPTSLSLAA